MNKAGTCKIAVFDSGVGGLTVLKELLRIVPQADYLYFGDTARLPYGSKSAETVAKYAISAAHFLEAQGAEVFDGGAKPDVLLLGCTHYPLLRPLLERLVPAGVTIVDSAESTAAAVREQIGNTTRTRASAPQQSSLHCFATDSVAKFKLLGERFLDRPLDNVQHVDTEA